MDWNNRKDRDMRVSKDVNLDPTRPRNRDLGGREKDDDED